MKRRWELMLLVPACLLLFASGCRTQLPAEFSRMQPGNTGTPMGGGAPAPMFEADNGLAPPGDGLNQDGPPIDVPQPGVYDSDALYAIPQQATAGIGEAVRIVVATGAPAHSFKFMNGVRVTFSAGEPSFVDGSYNVGAVGGAQLAADGIWAALNPESFLLPTDYMLGFTNYDGASGTWAIDFNVTPINAGQVAGSEGELFNFAVAFAQAGTVALGFEQFNQVKRCYYSDENSAEYFWGDISNSYPGVANSIVVE